MCDETIFETLGQRRVRNILITGASGFVGSYLARGLESRSLTAGRPVTLPSGVDITSLAALREFFASHQVDDVVHLASRTFVPDAVRDPLGTFEVNATGTLNLLVALREAGFNGTFLFVSSGDVYGLLTDPEERITERTPVAPRNPYSVSKLAAEEICRQWKRSEGWKIRVARPFNHIGPGQSVQFVISHLASQVASIARGERFPVIEVGDIDVYRDFTDVRDVVRAYDSLLRYEGDEDTFVIGSGESRSIRSVIEELHRMCRVDFEVKQDNERIRKLEQRQVRVNPALINDAVAWKAQIPFEQTIRDIYQSFQDGK